jgi:predicted MPP superfamily phosphohydrolase
MISRRTLLKSAAATAIAIPAGLASYGYLYERHAVQVTREQVPVKRLPQALDGLTIGLLTDVHRSAWFSADDVQAATAAVMAAQPDLIVLGGDYVTWGDRQFVGPSAESLAPLAAPHGVFAILGNHDDDHDMPAALSARGIQVLKDARTRLSIRGETLELAGIRFWTRRQNDIANVIRGAAGPVILLAHDPRRLTQAAALKIPLILSGHTHGGQVVLPGVGAVAAQRFPVVAGLAIEGDSTIFVSRGLGTVWLPVRLNCPPEVAVLTLRAA